MSSTTENSNMQVPAGTVFLLFLYMLLVVAGASYQAYATWPVMDGVSASASQAATPPDPTAIAKKEKDLVLFVMYLGVLGASIHAMTSMATYVGNRSFRASWAVWYLLRPIIGAVLAWIVYLVFRGGFLGGSQVSALNPYAFGAVGAMSGLFSKRVIDKLSELVDTMFRMPPGQGDDARANKVTAASAAIVNVTPSKFSESLESTKMTITGTGFTQGSTVEIAGVSLTPTTVKSEQIEVTVPVETFLGKQSVELKVRAGGPKGVASNVMKIAVSK